MVNVEPEGMAGLPEVIVGISCFPWCDMHFLSQEVRLACDARSGHVRHTSAVRCAHDQETVQVPNADYSVNIPSNLPKKRKLWLDTIFLTSVPL